MSDPCLPVGVDSGSGAPCLACGSGSQGSHAGGHGVPAAAAARCSRVSPGLKGISFRRQGHLAPLSAPPPLSPASASTQVQSRSPRAVSALGQAALCWALALRPGTAICSASTPTASGSAAPAAPGQESRHQGKATFCCVSCQVAGHPWQTRLALPGHRGSLTATPPGSYLARLSERAAPPHTPPARCPQKPPGSSLPCRSCTYRDSRGEA